MATNVEAGQGDGPTSKAREGAEQIKEKALQRVDEAREKAAAGKDRLSERVRRISSIMRSAGQDLRQEDEFVARYADRVSERFERAAEYVRTVDPKQALRDVESFARREPAMLFGGAFLLGLAAARFLKSSQRVSAEGGWDTQLELDVEE